MKQDIFTANLDGRMVWVRRILVTINLCFHTKVALSSSKRAVSREKFTNLS